MVFYSGNSGLNFNQDDFILGKGFKMQKYMVWTWFVVTITISISK